MTIAKRQIGLRIPSELATRLENHINKIGISKQAFILSLIYRELKLEAEPESESLPANDNHHKDGEKANART